MNVRQSVGIILRRFTARKFNGKAAREDLRALLEFCDETEREKLNLLIKAFRRPGFDSPEFKQALHNFQT